MASVLSLIMVLLRNSHWLVLRIVEIKFKMVKKFSKNKDDKKCKLYHNSVVGAGGHRNEENARVNRIFVKRI